MNSLDYPFRVISIFYFLHLLEDIVQTVNVDIAIVGAGAAVYVQQLQQQKQTLT